MGNQKSKEELLAGYYAGKKRENNKEGGVGLEGQHSVSINEERQNLDRNGASQATPSSGRKSLSRKSLSRKSVSGKSASGKSQSRSRSRDKKKRKKDKTKLDRSEKSVSPPVTPGPRKSKTPDVPLRGPFSPALPKEGTPPLGTAAGTSTAVEESEHEYMEPTTRKEKQDQNDYLYYTPVHQAGRLYYAMFDYVAQTEHHLSIKTGDQVFITDQSDPDWWLAKTTSNETGFVPASYLCINTLVLGPWYFKDCSRADAER